MDKTKNKSTNRPRDDHGRFEAADQAQHQKAKSQNKGGRSSSNAKCDREM